MIPWARRIETLCRVLARDTSSELTTMLAASLQVSSQQSVCEDRLVTRQLRGDGEAVVFMVGGCNRGTVQQSVAGTHVHVLSVSRLFREERTVTDPKFCEGFEILLVSTSNCVFLPTFNAETTLSRRVWLDLYHK